MVAAPTWGIPRFRAYINKKGGTHFQALLRLLVDLSGSVAADSRHSSSSQTHSGLPQYDSRLVISAEPAHHYRVVSPSRGPEFDIQTVGNSIRAMFATVHNAHFPKFMSPVPEPRALAVDALYGVWWRSG